jgi:hypothetical protein
MISLLLRFALTLGTAGMLLESSVASAPQRATAMLPPVPFEDVGACPFEGCVYGEWTPKQVVAIREVR